MAGIKHFNIFGDPYDLGGVGTDQAVVNITRSGTTFTATRADGTTFTFTQQDLNTWNANSKTVAGYVAAPGAVSRYVWMTDASGNPAWRNLTAGNGVNGLMSAYQYLALSDLYSQTGANLVWNTAVAKTDYGTAAWRDGKVGHLYFNMTFSSYGEGTWILQLPEFFVPLKTMDFNVIPNAGTEHPYMRIEQTTGYVRLYGFNAGTSQGIRALISYPIVTYPNPYDF